MCLVRAWKTGLDASQIALILSHHMSGAWCRKILRSRRSRRSHERLAAVSARLRYSDSVDDRATVCCFLTLQEIGLVPKYIHYPLVERQSIGSPAQSASQYAMRQSGPGRICNPNCNVPFKKQRICLTATMCSVVAACINCKWDIRPGKCELWKRSKKAAKSSGVW